jgi:hypothetical protein
MKFKKYKYNLTDLGLWRNVIPKGTLKTRFEPSPARMSAWKIIKLHSGFEPKTPASVISTLSLVGLSKPDNYSSLKVVHVKILVDGTNLPIQ